MEQKEKKRPSVVEYLQKFVVGVEAHGHSNRSSNRPSHRVEN